MSDPTVEPDAEAVVVPWEELGMTATLTGAAFDADGTPLDADGNRIEQGDQS